MCALQMHSTTTTTTTTSKLLFDCIL